MELKPQFVYTTSMSLISSLLLVQFLISSITHGPMLGDLTSDSVRIWLRTDTPEKVTIVLRDLASDPPSFHHYPLATTAEIGRAHV